MALLAAVAVVAGRTGGDAQAADAPKADTVFLNGRVMLFPKGDGSPASLMAPTLDWAQAVAVTDGTISYVGEDVGARAQIGPDTKVVDLRNKLLMPSLGDGHLHGGNPPQCDLNYEGGTIDTVLKKLKDCLQREDQAPHPNSNYRLTASNLMGDGLLPRGARLDRHVLDRLSKDPSEDPYGTGTTRPIVVRNMDGHKSYTNTKALQNGNVTAATPDPPDGFIGRDPDGTPNGQFADWSANWGPSLPSLPDAAYKGRLANYAYANSLGITNVMHPGGSRSSLDLLKRIADDGKLTVRVNQALSAGQVRGEDDPAVLKSFVNGLDAVKKDFNGYESPASPGAIEVDTVKVFCDGVPEFPGQTAAMLRPYRVNVGTAENPQWVPGDRRGEEPSCEDATAGFKALDADRWNIHVHSLGDRSTRVTLDNYEAAAKANASWDRRHQITHLEFVDRADLKRFGQLGVVASMTGQWNQRDGWSIDGIEGYVEPDRMDNMYPSKDIIAGGGVVSQGSDWPVTNLLPWAAIEQFVTREGQVDPAKAIYPGALNGKDGIALAQAYRASTIGVAYQLHLEDVTGSIEVGKAADLIVVDADPFFVAGLTDALQQARQDRDAAKARVADATAERATADGAVAAAKAAAGRASAAEQAAGGARAGSAQQLAAASRARTSTWARYTAAKKARRTASAKRRSARAAVKRRSTAARRQALRTADRRYKAADRKRTSTRATALRAAAAETAARQADERAAQALASARDEAAKAAAAVEAAERGAAASAAALAEAERAVSDAEARIADLDPREKAAREAAVKQISETKVLTTLLAGQVVYAAEGNPLGLSAE
ncbi:amidohydrolase [Patulibacter defluvii]|uniref:amidohydrolase n=1 Tax=Patulibacter defluvii TaxID=3095358 RepID=UPI002A747DFA|nr:amidohydrolase [Patulibacter sp. DM4]